MNILTVHFNTIELTEAMVRSVNKTTPNCKIYIFDNSDKKPFTAKFDNVEIIDNTQGQIINFGKWLDSFPDKHSKDQSHYGSAKHAKSVDICFHLLPEGFILLDSDVLIKQDITPLWSDEHAWTGEEHLSQGHFINIPRVLPFVCHINVPLCVEYGVTYFHPQYMWKLTRVNPDRFYDTGAWFLQSSKEHKAPYRLIKHTDYVEHYGNGSWRDKNSGEWLEQHKSLWI